MRVRVTVVVEGGAARDALMFAEGPATAADVAYAVVAWAPGPVSASASSSPSAAGSASAEFRPNPATGFPSVTVGGTLGGGTGVASGDTDVARTVFLPGQRSSPHPVKAADGSALHHGGEAGPRPVVEVPVPRLWADGRLVALGTPVAEFLRDGMRLSADPTVGPLLRTGEPVGRHELRVAGGPGAGRVLRLGPGTATVGSGADCALTVPDGAMPTRAVRVAIGVDGTARLSCAPGVRALLDGTRVEGEVPWPPGEFVRCGDSLLVLGPSGEADAHLAPTGDGGLAYNRPPRLNPPPPARRLRVPEPPSSAEQVRFPMLVALASAVFGLTLFLLTGHWYMLLFCAMGPLTMLAQWISDRRDGRRRSRTSMKRYRQDLAAYRSERERLGVLERRERRAAAPDPGEVLLLATGPRRRLWERRSGDADALRLRIGTGTRPAATELVREGAGDGGREETRTWVLDDVPVALPFVRLGVVGVAGERGPALSTTRWLAAQAAVLHSPRELTLVVLAAGPSAGADWDFAHWLPHTAPDQGQDCLVLIAAEPQDAARRVRELLGELERRRAARAHAHLLGARPDPAVLVVLDGARALRRIPGVPQLLTEGPEFGIVALCLDEDERLLPEECRAVVRWSGDDPRHVRLRGRSAHADGRFLADQVTTEWCELLARSLAPVRDVSRDDQDRALPLQVRLLDLLGMTEPDSASVERRWRTAGATTVAVLGAGVEGQFAVDLRRDGPHALIAGTTGAGKSELLQTLIASLALANRPDELNFVLVDYKGGSAFMDCARLPHTVGTVTDLDPQLTERALASLAAELHHRETVLFRTGTKDIEDYGDARTRRPELEPMPRLVLVIDEFASLVTELPDFVVGLVDIARRGRSLGVHLVLATQRPAGVVTADIRANTNLRIALRVTDPAESVDVIDAPDAAAVPRTVPGRAYVRSGAGSLVAMQSARIGGRRPATGRSGPRVRLSCIGPGGWGARVDGTGVDRAVDRAVDVGVAGGGDGSMVTDLRVLVDALGEAARRLGFGPQRSPWLEPLPERVELDEVGAVTEADPGDRLKSPRTEAVRADIDPVVYGLVDLPARQSRAPLALDLVRGEHTLVVGGARSGRSTVLRTLAGSLARGTSPQDAHLFAVDCGSSALLPLVRLPHVGAVAARDEPDRVRRLLLRLSEEITRRQRLLAAQGNSSVAEQRACSLPEARLPWLVLLLDNWEGFTAAFETYHHGRVLDLAHRLFREGAAAGVKIVMTGDRSALSGHVSASFADRLVLRFADPGDYSVAGLAAREVPRRMPAGRALRLGADGVDEAQVALLTADPSGQAQVRALHGIADAARARYGCPPTGLRPMRVDALPAHVTLPQALALDPDFVAPGPLWTVLGVGGNELGPVGIDLSEDGPGFLVAGPPRSGRSGVLATAATYLLDRGTQLIVVTPRRSPLRELEDRRGVLGTLTADSREDELAELREKAGGRPYVMVVDDAELLHDSRLDETLEDALRGADEGSFGLLAAGTTDSLASQYRGFTVSARRSRNGLLLMPGTPSDGELFGTRLPAGIGGGAVGSGILFRNGEYMAVQGAVRG